MEADLATLTWIRGLTANDRATLIDFVQENPDYGRQAMAAVDSPAVRRRLIERARSWTSGKLLRAILEDQACCFASLEDHACYYARLKGN